MVSNHLHERNDDAQIKCNQGQRCACGISGSKQARKAAKVHTQGGGMGGFWGGGVGRGRGTHLRIANMQTASHFFKYTMESGASDKGLPMACKAAHLLGMRKSLSPFLTMPASLLPMAMAPMSLYLSMMDILKGDRGSLGRGSVLSRISKRVPPWYQAHRLGSTAFMMLSPNSPEIGRKTRSFFGL